MFTVAVSGRANVCRQSPLGPKPKSTLLRQALQPWTPKPTKSLGRSKKATPKTWTLDPPKKREERLDFQGAAEFEAIRLEVQNLKDRGTGA